LCIADASPKTSDRFPISLTDKSIFDECVRDLSRIAMIFLPSKFCFSSVNCVRIFLTIDEFAAPQRPQSDVAPINKCFCGPSVFSTSKLS
jgi:hypothetical protein